MEYQIELCGDIGIEECSFNYVQLLLAKFQDKPVNVRINSPGGYASDGFKIMQAFREHGQVTCFLEGLVASAATIVSMGAQKIVISPYTQYLIHQSASPILAWDMMNQDQIRDYIKNLKRQLSFNETLDKMAAQLYADRCGKEAKHMASLMQKAEWMTAQEVIDLGLADEMGERVGSPASLTPVMKAKLQAMQLPLPDLLEEPAADQSFIQRIAFAVASIINPKHVVPVVTEPEPQTTVTMNKNFIAVMALLAIEAIAETDGKLSLDTDQMQKINDALASLDALKGEKTTLQQQIDQLNAQLTDKGNELTTLQSQMTEKDGQITTLQSQLAEKDQQIAALKAAPAAQTPGVVQQPGKATLDVNKPEDAMAIAQAFVNSRRV